MTDLVYILQGLMIHTEHKVRLTQVHRLIIACQNALQKAICDAKMELFWLF